MNPNVAANKKHKTASRRGGDSVAADATMVERSSVHAVKSEKSENPDPSNQQPAFEVKER